MRLLAAASLYVGLTFLAGALLGAVRVPLLVPLLGEFWAVAVEAPFILAAAGAIAAGVMRSHPVPPAALGGLALVLLLGVEIGLGWLLRGLSPAAWLRHLVTPAGALSLLLYLGFAGLPVGLSARRRRRNCQASARR